MNRDRETDQPAGPVRQVPAEARAGEETGVLQLAEETLRVGKRAVVGGRVRVSTLTRQHEELVQQELAREDVEVTRVPVDREVDAAPGIRQDGDVTVIPILEEVLVVERRLVLKEEVHIRRTRSTDHVETPVVLRRQEAVIQRLDADGAIIPEESDT